MSGNIRRYEDSKEVLAYAEELINQIASAYVKAATDEELLAASKTQIKGAVEGIRSALEYTAQDIWSSYTTKKNSVYFPYGKDEAAFLISVQKNLPALKEQVPSLFSLVESVQPHFTGESWLVQLCAVSNFNKHNGLSSQLRKNSPGNRTDIGGMIRVINSENVTINTLVNGKPIGKNGPVIVSTSASTKDIRSQLVESISVTREFDWVEFHIDTTGADALVMLKKALKGVRFFVEGVNSEINK